MKRLILFGLAILATSLLLPLLGGSLPAHDARFLKVAVVYELNDDGSWDMTCEQRVRLDTYYAVNRALGETFIIYNPDFQKLEVLKSETTMADGRKILAPDNAFNEVLPFAAHGFADFSGLREMVVTHTGLERGALIDLKYRIHTQAGFLPAFSGREVLARDFPVDSYLLEIRIPASQQLHLAGGGLRAEIITETVVDGPVRKYSVRLSGLAPLPREPLAATGSEPFMAFSLAPDWVAALPLAGEAEVLPAAMTEKVSQLKARHPALADLLGALQQVVAVELGNCGLGIEATGWRSRPLERVVQGNYATRLEKALLLKALLTQAGIDAELLAVAAGPDLAVAAPTSLQLEEFWLKVPAIAAYLDPCRGQHEFFPYSLQGRDAWNFASQSLEKLPATSGEQNLVDISGKVQLTADGACGTLLVMARGMFNRYNEATADHGQAITAILKKIFPLGKVEVKKLLELTRQQIRAEVAFSATWLKESGAGFLSMEPLRLPGLDENMVILDTRETSLALEAPFQVFLQLDIDPAPELKLEVASPPVERKNSTGHFSRSLTRVKNGLLRFCATVAIEKGVISPEEYPLLRELLLPYFSPDFGLVFKKQK